MKRDTGLASLLDKLDIRARRSPDILETLFVWYSKSVYRTAFFILRDRWLAEDVVQETFMVACTKLDQLQSPDKVEGWLIRVAMRKAYDLIRNNHRLIFVQEPVILEQPDFSPVLDIVIDRETAEEIKMAISNLPSSYRAILYSRFYLESTFKQIADALEMPEGTAKSRLGKAKFLIVRKLGVKQERRAVHGNRKAAGSIDRESYQRAD
jgi:RNA polymerase sigma-70 factor (ECF subfamily)